MNHWCRQFHIHHSTPMLTHWCWQSSAITRQTRWCWSHAVVTLPGTVLTHLCIQLSSIYLFHTHTHYCHSNMQHALYESKCHIFANLHSRDKPFCCVCIHSHADIVKRHTYLHLLSHFLFMWKLCPDWRWHDTVLAGDTGDITVVPMCMSSGNVINYWWYTDLHIPRVWIQAIFFWILHFHKL